MRVQRDTRREKKTAAQLLLKRELFRIMGDEIVLIRFHCFFLSFFFLLDGCEKSGSGRILSFVLLDEGREKIAGLIFARVLCCIYVVVK